MFEDGGGVAIIFIGLDERDDIEDIQLLGGITLEGRDDSPTSLMEGPESLIVIECDDCKVSMFGVSVVMLMAPPPASSSAIKFWL